MSGKNGQFPSRTRNWLYLFSRQNNCNSSVLLGFSTKLIGTGYQLLIYQNVFHSHCFMSFLMLEYNITFSFRHSHFSWRTIFRLPVFWQYTNPDISENFPFSEFIILISKFIIYRKLPFKYIYLRSFRKNQWSTDNQNSLIVIARQS